MAVPTSMVSGQGNASAVSSPKTPEYPGRSSLPELLHCPKRTVSFGQSPSEGASQIPYQDDRERLNSTLQVAFTDNLRHGNNTSSPYKKVAVLLISWHANFDDLNTKAEVDRLGHVFQETFGYQVSNVHLTNRVSMSPLAQVQLLSHISNFVLKEDGPHTLLIVYYAGHGTPGPSPGGLELSGKRCPSTEVADVVQWNIAEAPLQRTQADVFEILDCCYAGDLGRTRGLSTRCFEFLAATSSGSTTCVPGPKSFTSGLIWALQELAKKRPRFTTSELANKIRERHEFPSDQVPVLFERNATSETRIVLSALPKHDNSMETIVPEQPDAALRRELLDLKFVLQRIPTEEEVVLLAEAVNSLIRSQGLLIHRVIWGGIEPDIVQKAVRRWRDVTRRKSLLYAPSPVHSPSSPPSGYFPRLSTSQLACHHAKTAAIWAGHGLGGFYVLGTITSALIVGLVFLFLDLWR